MTPEERAEVRALCEKYPHIHRKIIEAQLLNDRRKKRIAQKQQQQDEKNDPWQYKHSIFDRSK